MQKMQKNPHHKLHSWQLEQDDDDDDDDGGADDNDDDDENCWSGTVPPESCFFGQMLNIGALLLVITVFIR